MENVVGKQSFPFSLLQLFIPASDLLQKTMKVVVHLEQRSVCFCILYL